MIKNMMPLSMTKALEFVGDKKDSETEIRKFMKKFIKIKPEKAEEIRRAVESLNFMKVKPEHVAKIIDILPEDAESLNKIFTDISLDEDETKKILDTIKGI